MDNTGPPPLAKEKIDEIPKCEITQQHVDSKLQCSVCWEDFQLSENVRQLPCSVRLHLIIYRIYFLMYTLQHIYHEDCILPWLALHGTCPVCRKSLDPDSEAETGNRNTIRKCFDESFELRINKKP